jgi:DNA invertase Pin-like site-specific DNA recombinase
MQAGILSVFAQYEREFVGQRTKQALAVKRAQGVRLGRPPAVLIDVRARIRNDRNAGKSLRSIAEALTKDGPHRPRGTLARIDGRLRGLSGSTSIRWGQSFAARPQAMDKLAH